MKVADIKLLFNGAVENMIILNKILRWFFGSNFWKLFEFIFLWSSKFLVFLLEMLFSNFWPSNGQIKKNVLFYPTYIPTYSFYTVHVKLGKNKPRMLLAGYLSDYIIQFRQSGLCFQKLKISKQKIYFLIQIFPNCCRYVLWQSCFYCLRFLY